MTSEEYQTSLADELTNTIEQLHRVFDEIGIARSDRDAREAALYAALNATLHAQLHQVQAEKHALVDECRAVMDQIKMMERGLSGRDADADDAGLRLTTPLIKCLAGLKDKHRGVKKRHAERYDSIKKLVQAVGNYAAAMEPDLVEIALPPITDDSAAVAAFDLSDAYYAQLELEFNRIYDEYTRRSTKVMSLANDMVNLYAELGTPAAQIDQPVLQFGNSEPERLGLTVHDLELLSEKKEKLVQERSRRQARVAELTDEITVLWDKLEVEPRDQKVFLAQHRGSDQQCIRELEEELARLLELKKANLHVFVEDARYQIQQLWEKLYYSEDEMTRFSPMRSEVMTDALLSAHEMEINRLEALLTERGPTLALIEKHRALLADKEQLAISASDSSRLLRGRGANLLQEEKMRKRIQKEMPRVESELKQALEDYENETGLPFLVHGESYLDLLRATGAVATSRSQSRAGSTASSMSFRSTPAPENRPPTGMRGRANTVHAPANPRARSKPAPVEKQPMRSKTPTGMTRPKTPSAGLGSGTMSVSRAAGRSLATQLDRSGMRTPAPGGGRPPAPTTGLLRPKTPTSFARPPLSTFSHNPARPAPESASAMSATVGRSQSVKVHPKPAIAPPPRMNRLGPSGPGSAAGTPTPAAQSQFRQPRMQEKELHPRIRSVSPYSEDYNASVSGSAYSDDRDSSSSLTAKRPAPRHIGTYMECGASARAARDATVAERPSVDRAPLGRASSERDRQTSIGSQMTDSSGMGTGSENWETFGASDDENEQQTERASPVEEAEAAEEDDSAEYMRRRNNFASLAVKQQTSASAKRGRMAPAPATSGNALKGGEVEEWSSDEGF